MAFTTIRDRTVIQIATDASGIAFAGANLNASPTGDSTEFLAFGNPTAVQAQFFKKFNWYKKLYEQCRCRWIRWKWVPLHPFDSTTTTPEGYAPVYYVAERDAIDWGVTTSVPSSDQILSEPKVKILPRNRPWTVFQRCTKYGPFNKTPPPLAALADQTGCNIWGQWHGVGTSLADVSFANGAHQYFAFFSSKPSATLGYFIIDASFDLKGMYYQAS